MGWSRRTWPRASRAASRRASRDCRSRTPLVIRPSPLYDLPIAVERVRAARQAIDQSGEDVLLTARAECYHVGHPDPLPRERPPPAGVRRSRCRRALRAGSADAAEIEALVAAVAPSRSTFSWFGTSACVWTRSRRSACDASASAARWHWRRGPASSRAAQTLKSEGSFAGLASLVPYPEINGLFAAPRGQEAVAGSAT